MILEGPYGRAMAVCRQRLAGSATPRGGVGTHSRCSYRCEREPRLVPHCLPDLGSRFPAPHLHPMPTLATTPRNGLVLAKGGEGGGPAFFAFRVARRGHHLRRRGLSPQIALRPFLKILVFSLPLGDVQLQSLLALLERLRRLQHLLSKAEASVSGGMPTGGSFHLRTTARATHGVGPEKQKK